jgi:hypothetical protein
VNFQAFMQVAPSDDEVENDFNKLIHPEGPLPRVMRSLWLHTEAHMERFLSFDLGSAEGVASATKLQGEILGKRRLIMQLLAQPDDDKLVEKL